MQCRSVRDERDYTLADDLAAYTLSNEIDFNGIGTAIRPDYDENVREKHVGDKKMFRLVSHTASKTPVTAEDALQVIDKSVTAGDALKAIKTKQCVAHPTRWMIMLSDLLANNFSFEEGVDLECPIEDLFGLGESYLTARSADLSAERIFMKLKDLPQGTVIRRDQTINDATRMPLADYTTSEDALRVAAKNIDCLYTNFKYAFRRFSLRRWHTKGLFKGRLYYTNRGPSFSSVKDVPGWLTFDLPFTSIFDYFSPRALIFQLGFPQSAQIVFGRVPSQEILDALRAADSASERAKLGIQEIDVDTEGSIAAYQDNSPCSEDEWKYVVLETGVGKMNFHETVATKTTLKALSKCYKAPQVNTVIDSKGEYSTIVLDKKNPDPIGTVMVDAGSSGSKLFSFVNSSERNSKMWTTCNPLPGTNETFDLQGASTLTYSMDFCQAEMKKDSETERIELFDSDCRRKRFPTILLDHVRKLHSLGASETRIAKNALNVPMLATAGMRLLSAQQNNQIWGDICGHRDVSGTYKFARRESGDCGTIPGTKEAYYEYLAFATKNPSGGGSQPPLTGIFSIGGASAQIAIPLVTESEESEFKSLMEVIKSRLSCRDVLLATGEPIPIFNQDKACHKDFVDLMDASSIPPHIKIPEWDAWKENGKPPRGLALVSFLGLGHLSGAPDGEIGIAGGVNMIEVFSNTLKLNTTSGDTVGCSSDSTKFDWQLCKNAFKQELKRDLLFSEVAKFFKKLSETKALSMTHFSYNTNAAVPSKVFGGDGMTKDYNNQLEALENDQQQIYGVAEVLDSILDTWCSGNDTAHPYVKKEDLDKEGVPLPNANLTQQHLNQKFGFKREKSCMTGLWTSSFISEIFGQARMLWGQKVKLDAALASGAGQEKDLGFHPVDWALGVMVSFLETDETSGTSTDTGGGMKAMISSHSSSYIHGAALVLDS